MDGRNILIALHIKNKGNWGKSYEDIKNKTEVDFEKYLVGVDTTKYTTILDIDYPHDLKQAYKPPFVYNKGEDIVSFRCKNMAREKAIEICKKDYAKNLKNVDLKTNELSIVQDNLEYLQIVLEQLQDLESGKYVVGLGY